MFDLGIVRQVRGCFVVRHVKEAHKLERLKHLEALSRRQYVVGPAALRAVVDAAAGKVRGPAEGISSLRDRSKW